MEAGSIMSKKVIVAGHICLDITPIFPDVGKTRLSEVIMPGKLVETNGASVSTGGAVANTGLAMKMLGADVRLMGKTGTDDFGEMISGILRRFGAEKDMIRAEGEDTSYSVVLAIPGIDRMFLHCPGANNTYEASDIPDEILKETALLHFGYPPLMKKMYENNGRQLTELMKKAQDSGCATSMDMSAVDPDSEAGKADWTRIIQNTVKFVDFFVPSIEELCFMLDRKRFDEWQNRAGNEDITTVLDIEKDIRPLADQCMAFGCKVLMLKCGAPGLYFRTASRSELEKISPRLGLDASVWADKEGFERSFKPDAVLSGTGAGDTCIAAYLTAMLNGNTPEECISLAAATGACCVSSYDALLGLRPLDELRDRIAGGWERSLF